MSLIESESIYSIFPADLITLDFNGLVPDSPAFKKNGIISNNNSNNNNNKQNNGNGNNSNNNLGSSSNTSPEQNSQSNQQNQHQQQHQHIHQLQQNQHHQQQQHLNGLQYPTMINTNTMGGNGMDEQFLQIFLSQNDKDNLNNNNNNNNINNIDMNNFISQNNIIKYEDLQNQHINMPMNDQYNNGLVPDSLNISNNLIKKIDFNHDPIKHYVPDSINYDINQPIYHYQQPNLNSLNNSNINNSNGKTPKGISKKKDEEGKIKKRKFITSTPVKGENGTILIPTTDGNCNLEEERTMKRQRRLVKNREAAQLFRQRQKAYIQDLEKKVNDLTSTNSEFRARVELLNSENKLIREQLLYLRNFITQAVSFSFPPKVGGSSSPNGANNGSGLSSPIPQGICPPDMLNLQNPMIMSAIAEAASKNSTFRQNFISIPSPPLSQPTTVSNSPNKTQQQVPFLSSNNSPPQQMSITPPSQRK